MSHAPIKPTHKAIQNYYRDLNEYAERDVEHEGALETAFSHLLADTARAHGWSLTPIFEMKAGGKRIVPDGALRDECNLLRGYWEAKDTRDNLDDEIRKKIKSGYPLVNTIFEDTREAVLYQNGVEVARFKLKEPQQLADLLTAFYSFTEPDIEGFEQAVAQFKERVPELAQGLDAKIKEAHRDNAKFQKAFDGFFTLCQQTLNPNIRTDAVDEMLVQHLLTERLFRTVFQDPDFIRRNVIAAEVEKVIDALTGQSFSRVQYLKTLDKFYKAIEGAAALLEDFTQKQHFLNTVYERFFQGYSVKVADTHGIVYTPQEIVDFMCASVAEVLEKEFKLTLGSPGVNILDPCTGTGNFVVNLLRRIPKKDLPRVYKEQLFANEVMLLPYYIAALNIEHAYYEMTGKYESFEGLCFVDTLDLADKKDSFHWISEKNSERVVRQRQTPITVIVGNPPYNAWQLDENDNNKNRKYPTIDNRIRETYAKDSSATNKNALSDTYVKFFRWAVDRLGDRNGIVCFVTNNSFVDQIAFDGMRKHLMQSFEQVYVINLKGNIRKDSMRDGIPLGENHTVFGLSAMVGISVTVLVKKASLSEHTLYYNEVHFRSTRAEKFRILKQAQSISGMNLETLVPDANCTWLVPENASEFSNFLSIADKESKAVKALPGETVFKTYGRGVATSRDNVVYDFSHALLKRKVLQFIDDYNAEIDRYGRHLERELRNTEKTKEKHELLADLDTFVNYDRIKWSRDLKLDLQRGNAASFHDSKLRVGCYRPFSKRFLFFDRILNEEVYVMPRMLPTQDSEGDNRLIAMTDLGSEKPFMSLICNLIPDLHLVGAGASCQCFPFYVYDEDGSNRRENITDWALAQFQERYGAAKKSKTSEPPGLSRRRSTHRDKPGGSPAVASGSPKDRRIEK